MSAELGPEQRNYSERPLASARGFDTRSTRPTMSLGGVRGVYGATLLAAFVLVLVGGIVATVWSLQAMNAAGNEVTSVVALVLGVVTIFASVMIWQGRHEIGGIFAVVTGIIFLVLGPDMAGVFAVLGGILAVIANRVSDVVA